MPKSQMAYASDKDYAKRLRLLECQSEAYFERLQRIYNAAKNASDPQSIELFLSNSETVETIRSDFMNTLNEINSLKLDNVDDYVPDYKKWSAFEDIFSHIVRTKKRLLSDQQSERSRSVTTRSKPLLPPIEIPTFNGDPRTWSMFIASFNSTVHENNALSDSEKMYYLIGRLIGKAQSVVAGVTPTGENYNVVYQSLVDKYEDKRMLATSYLDTIFNLQKINNATSNNLEYFSDNFTSAVHALYNLKIENISDFILMYIALKKLDSETVRSFEMSERNNKIPTLNNLFEFVKEQAKILYRTSPHAVSGTTSHRQKQLITNKHKPPSPQSYVTSLSKPSSPSCLCDTNIHKHLYHCRAFHNLTPTDRYKLVKERSFCISCLSTQHIFKDCKSTSRCRTCGQPHHTMLHFTGTSSQPSAGVTCNVNKGNNNIVSAQTLSLPHSPITSASSANHDIAALNVSNALSACGSSFVRQSDTVLLSTARVCVYDAVNNAHVARVLIDSGSQVNFITEELCQRLSLRNSQHSLPFVKGIGGSIKPIKRSVRFTFYSRFDRSINYEIDALVVDKITDNLPTARVDASVFTYLNELQLADDSFMEPGPIDILIGASLFSHLLLPHKVHNASNIAPPAIQSVLGYVIMGSAPILSAPCTMLACYHASPEPLEVTLKRFWELEEIICNPARPLEHRECEELYLNSTTRDLPSGRYVVALPFKDDPSTLGDSFAAAKRRFLYLENKFKRLPQFKLAYDNVIRDHLEKGFLSLVTHDGETRPSYTIAHHGVFREDKVSSKLRVVLDASMKTSTDVSLNDILHSGPNLQGDLFKILLNFRLFATALAADVRQMFLCIGVREADRCFQRILYRFDPQQPISVYQFNRVCFGLKSSPYLALRTIQRLFAEHGDSYPCAKMMESCLYMDDFVFSVQSEKEAVLTAKQLINLLKLADFDLVKWTSNSREVLSSIPASHRLEPEIQFDKTLPHKILGVQWNPVSDCFSFQVKLPSDQCTKRTILSTVARLWDILGFVAPVILHAKLLIKQLWILGLKWDERPPSHIVQLWNQFRSELPVLNNLKIPRYLGVADGCTMTLLGFADASERAYGGVVYLHVASAQQSSIQLVCAKSKVSPVRIVSVARLELCAALLLSQLIKVVVDQYQSRYPISKVYAFSDSTVALCWIHSSPHRWHVFVANRVTKIIENISPNDFYHIDGKENPADCLSRGLTPAQIIEHPLWFHGPPWARHNRIQWPVKPFSPSGLIEVPEQKLLLYTAVTNKEDSFLYNIIKKYSSWSKARRVLIYIYRFLKILPRGSSSLITASDLKLVEIKILKESQNKFFQSEIVNLNRNKLCSPALQRLKPFIDEHGLIRVGGRLSYSDVDYGHQHPIVLSRHDHVAEMIVDYYHKKYCHSGPTLLMSILRQRYWILSARRLIRNRIFKCNVCFRTRPLAPQPPMADHKACRVTPSVKPFTHVGSDYAGPIKIAMTRGRGSRTTKAYICLFVCLTTRAVHIELASDLSTACFLDAFNRFLSRRGPVACMYTDNGTNFVGAKSYLNDLHKFLCSPQFKDTFAHELCDNRIQWHLNPPSAPHFGGNWESNVKSLKTHLFRVIGTQILSYEEMITVLSQVEAVLNSRPLCSTLSSDPSEILALTPAHFLTLTPLKSFPAPIIDDDRLHLLSRHDMINKLVQSFWKRWRAEYLHTLQMRNKWNRPDVPIEEGTVVVVNTDNLPPLQWPLGIVEKTHPAGDGIIRVVTVRTARGTFKRPVVKLCPLPSQ